MTALEPEGRASVPGTDARPSPEWAAIRDLTPARIGLARAGSSVATAAHLAFRADHARARDAVAHAFDADLVVADLVEAGHRSIAVRSGASTREQYIRRPDLGRVLSPEATLALTAVADDDKPCDLAIVVCDGLSPGAVLAQGAALVDAIGSSALLSDWSIGVVTVAVNGRVAVGDEIGAILAAGIVVVLIGERPGLSIPESIGAYITHSPAPGCTDAERNCVSNIHERGLSVADAARRVVSLLVQARTVGLTGVGLNDVDPRLLPRNARD